MADQDTGKDLECTNQGLPPWWAYTTLGEIRVDKGTAINPGKMPETIFELYSVPSYDTGRPEVVSGREIGSNKQVVAQDTVLLCKINPRINRTFVVGGHSPYQKIASTEWIPFFKVEGIVPDCLAYYMKINDFRDFLARNASGVGGSSMRVKPGTLAAYPLPLAPTSEQERIVEAIEMHFTRLDAGIDGLRQLQSKLKRYRAAILKAAVEGTLAEEWRAEHPDVEPASVLLQRILHERRSAWEQAELAKFARAGKTPPMGWQTKYTEPAAPGSGNLPQLPAGWCWATVEQVSHFARYGTSAKTSNEISGVPVLRMGNIQQGALDLSDLKYLPAIHQEFPDLLLERGDLLFNRTIVLSLLVNRLSLRAVLILAHTPRILLPFGW
jgi:type I restriction enzyme S subunit